MDTPDTGQITRILRSWDTDRQAAIDALTPMVYGELRKIAASYIRRERDGHTLQPTALIHEAYLRMVRQEEANLQDRTHFYTLAARMMRQILVDAARARQAQKRGEGASVVQIDGARGVADPANAFDILTLKDALDKLRVQDERKAQVVELRFFGGLLLDEIAAALEISAATVKRDLAMGEAWLRRALAHGAGA
jgi:RNA polymerase sigma factor (TIGR02999 family)